MTTTLRTVCERIAPVGPETTVAEACAHLACHPAARLLPVLNGGVYALASREAIVAASARGDMARRTVGELSLFPAPAYEAEHRTGELSGSLLARGDVAALQGFVVVERGAYLGVGDGLTLLRVAQSSPGAVGAVIDGVRREVGSPLEGLLAVAALMQRQPLSLDGAAHLRTMVAAAQGALAHLSDLAVSFGPIPMAPEMTPQPTSLPGLMDEVDVLWQVQAALRGLRLITSCRADPEVLVSVDPARFKQVLNALINEAFDRSHGGMVEAQLATERSGDQVRAEVRVRYAPRLGTDEAFSSEALTFAARPLERLVAAMGGRLRREANPGAGATAVVEFALPVARVSEDLGQAASAGISALGHILVVDDNVTNRLVAEALCEGFGFTCETAEDGAEAVEAARVRPFDLVLMDIKMPGMDGLEATRAIRALPGVAAEVPILALTANADPDRVVEYLAAGMGGVVEKPIKPEALFRAITAALYGVRDEVELAAA